MNPGVYGRSFACFRFGDTSATTRSSAYLQALGTMEMSLQWRPDMN